VDEDREFVFAGVVGDERDVADRPLAVPRDDRGAREQRPREPLPHPFLADGRRPLGTLGWIEVDVHLHQCLERGLIVRVQPDLPSLGVLHRVRRCRVRPFAAGQRLSEPVTDRRERAPNAVTERAIRRGSAGHRRPYGRRT
jgi:hypothetical protein